ncbi:hypothetical protein [Gemmatimonas sp. UBA7669]|uniref:hypothetical protein n=1 Tax=Gemmatimonas sp. UBA7669 TaxID=1946568 RepID=UPI0025BA3729|nr:hypothetical protein [Gemmatimonas sp. UBA7669]
MPSLETVVWYALLALLTVSLGVGGLLVGWACVGFWRTGRRLRRTPAEHRAATLRVINGD